jgi:S-adenosylmethionine-diacylglycerol 3-amino-3-carboxypropyl transferase
MGALFGFGLSQEDERTEAAALRLVEGDSCLCVASAGEMPLSLLAMGASEVAAVDLDPSQIHLTALKAATIRALDRAEALRFLGYLPASRPERRRSLARVLPLLPADSLPFWTRHREVAERGVIWQGRYERYIRLLVSLARPVLGRRRLEGLFAQDTLEAQRDYFDARIARPVLRSVFRLAFDPRVFARRGMDPRSLRFRHSATPLGDQYLDSFRAFCTGTPALQNHLLQLTLLGRLVDERASPACLQPHGMDRIRSRHDRLECRAADILSHLGSQPPFRFNKLHLSNLVDWLPAAEFEELLRTAAARLRRPGRLVWRYLHVARTVPEDLREVVRVDAELGARLAVTDRFPFYGIAPAAVGEPEP